MLHYADGRPFATGAARYDYRPPSLAEDTNRVMVKVQIESETTTAVLDTGAPYGICTPGMAERLDLLPDTADEQMTLFTARGPLRGVLKRVSLRFKADKGEPCTIEATMLVPLADEPTPVPIAFIGMGGCLERLRFALDPADDMLYFGEASAI